MLVCWFRKQICGNLAVINLNSNVQNIEGSRGVLGGRLNCRVELVVKLKKLCSASVKLSHCI